MRTPDRSDRSAPTQRSPGDFPSALRAAIRASGLSLDRIKYRLKQRGVSITVTTLSYWQTGKRRPERPESLVALAQLEQVFGMAAGSLVALLGPRRQRGRPRRPPPTVASGACRCAWCCSPTGTASIAGSPSTTC